MSCSLDCGFGPCGLCGDGVCNGNETIANCYRDCGGTKELQCSNNCSDHGLCMSSGICMCDQQYNGIDCSQDSQALNVTLGQTSPDLTVIMVNDSSVGFNIDITIIREVNAMGDVVQSVNISNTFFSKSSEENSNISTTIYNAIILENCNLTITIYLVKQSTTFSFVGMEIPLSSNSIKIMVEVDHWPFQTIANSLEILVNNEGSLADGCDDVGYNSQGHITWFKYFNGQYTLYSPLINVAEIDEKNQTIYYMFSNDQLIIVIPFFWNYALVDPSYAVLLESAPPGGCDTSESIVEKDGWIIVVAISVSSSMFVAIVAGTLLIIRNRRRVLHMKRVRSKEAISSSSDNL